MFQLTCHPQKRCQFFSRSGKSFCSRVKKLRMRYITAFCRLASEINIHGANDQNFEKVSTKIMVFSMHLVIPYFTNIFIFSFSYCWTQTSAYAQDKIMLNIYIQKGYILFLFNSLLVSFFRTGCQQHSSTKLRIRLFFVQYI